MTKRELEKLLNKNGFVKYVGGSHDLWKKAGFLPIPVHRHKGDIPIGTLKSIVKQAKLERLP